MTTSRQLGIRGETIAADYLEAEGWVVLSRNWRCSEGEIDIVARSAGPGREVALVEVKTRSSAAAGHPFEAITPSKLRRLRRLALTWSLANPEAATGRVDVIGILAPPDGEVVVEHLRAVTL